MIENTDNQAQDLRGRRIKRLLLLFFVAIVVGTGYGGYLVFNELKRSQEAAFNERAESIIQSLAQLGGHYIETFDRPLLEELVQSATSDPIVLAVQIEDFLSQQNFGETGIQTRKQSKQYMQELHRDDRIIGRVRVVVDETALQISLVRLTRFVWSAVAILVLVIGVFGYLLFQVRTHANAFQTEANERRTIEGSLKRLSVAVEQSPTSVVITNKNARIEYVNPKFLELTGYSSDEVIGQNPNILNSGLTPRETYRRLWDRLSEGKTWRGEFHNRKKNGEIYWEYASISPIRASDGCISHYLAVKEDITLRKDYEAQLVRQANFDSLTGLANRILARERLDQAIARARRDGSIVGLLFIDLDHFKKVNDTLGHAAGDDLLVETARRLQSCMREQDIVARSGDRGESGTVARLGGDEFTVILQGLRKPLDAEIVVERILNACARPFLVKDQELFLSASIGVTIFPDDAEDPEILMRNADGAMYQSKEEGRGTFRFFRREINDIARERMLMENELRQGFARGELELYFQPLFDSLSNSLEGAEAMLRWRSPSRGLVSPDDFIPLAEDTGLIVPIGEWVLHRACEQAAIWQTCRDRPLYVSVNVSTRQFQTSNLVETVSKALQATELPAECLKLEITESLLLQETEKTKSTVQALYDTGVRFSIDDFGTGYSSLNYLRNYPFESLKIDRSFICNVTSRQSDADLVESIIAIALNLNLKVVAEGIETDEQYAFIKHVGCDTAQGFRLGRPLPATEFLSRIASDDPENNEAVG